MATQHLIQINGNPAKTTYLSNNVNKIMSHCNTALYKTHGKFLAVQCGQYFGKYIFIIGPTDCNVINGCRVWKT